jgi:hypothetical protein
MNILGCKSWKTAVMVMALSALAIGVPSLADAATYEFDATSAKFGFLGSIEYDSSVFDVTNNNQYVDNTKILSLLFTDPLSGHVITTIGPTGNSTIFDSTGTLPIVVGGFGFTGGTDLTNGVDIADTYAVSLGTGSSNNEYDDVTWTTVVAATTFGTATPLPAALPLFATGLGALGLLVRRTKRKHATAA